MWRLATDSPARSAQEPAMSEGMTRLLPKVELNGSFNFIETEKRRTRSMRVRLFGRSLVGTIGVWTVSTVWVADWVVRVPDWAGLRRFSGEWRKFRGGTRFESHLGHVFSLFRGLPASECEQIFSLMGPSGAYFCWWSGAG
ncbi:hypothetical protein NicSoilB4_15480 [Arthrobacter sp. NicSoilB4]|nr:hypothetical protein NicSoilB4_15480 [Arthrobacter sp. NicSoilB4]